MFNQVETSIPLFFSSDYYCLFFPYNLQEPSVLKLEDCLTAEAIPNTIDFKEKFIRELEHRHQNSYVKEWTEEEEQKLLQLGKESENWIEISQHFNGKPAKVCERKHKKLLLKEEKWPKEIEETIKYFREVEFKSWTEIESIVERNFPSKYVYEAKKIRERYKNYLEIEVNRKKWTLAEDIELWNRLEEIGKEWKKIATFFPERSGLQLRNRFYKFLEPVKNKIEDSSRIKCV